MIQCKLCEKFFLQLNFHLLLKHGIKLKEYLSLFPNASYRDESLKKPAWNKDLTKETDERVRRYSENSAKRIEAARERFFKPGKDNINWEGKYGKTESYRKEHSRIMKEGHRTGKINPSPSCWKPGFLHPDWKGGISSEPYSFSFNDQLKDYIRNRDGNRCVICAKEGKKRKLCVHHINFDKRDCRKENLVTLCIAHNIKASRNEKFWRESFLVHISNLYSQRNSV